MDKLLNYIRFWQASGESEKTSIRVKTKHLQMIEDGQYRGGLVPYGYRLEQLGRMNKKNKPVPDLVIDQDEAAIVREIFHLLVNKGYGTVRVAKYLNDKGIKTKRNKGPWRGTAIRALIDNPIYIGHMHMGETLSPKFENLQIIDDDLFARCQEVVKGRATFLKKDMMVAGTDGHGKPAIRPPLLQGVRSQTLLQSWDVQAENGGRHDARLRA